MTKEEMNEQRRIGQQILLAKIIKHDLFISDSIGSRFTGMADPDNDNGLLRFMIFSFDYLLGGLEGYYSVFKDHNCVDKLSLYLPDENALIKTFTKKYPDFPYQGEPENVKKLLLFYRNNIIERIDDIKSEGFDEEVVKEMLDPILRVFLLFEYTH